MLVLLYFLFTLSLLAASAVQTGNGSSEVGSKADSAAPIPVLLVSFDGFRADYLKRFPLPNLKLLYSQGVLVEQMTNVFITKTFPNHYSLVTGLYAESHGVIASSMYDPATQKHFTTFNDTDSFWWNEASPIWVTALDFGYKTGVAMWPGSDVAIRNRTATHFLPYNRSVSFSQRLANVTHWLTGGEGEDPVSFAALYWEEPDKTGHMYGPDDASYIGQALKEVDENVGLLMSELKRAGLWGHVNIIVTSDHGMAQCSTDRLIRLDECLHPDNYTVVDLTPVAAIIPNGDSKAVFSLLSGCHDHMTAYLKKDIPDRLHYKNNDRIPPIILIADEGWTIVQRGGLPRLGDHGYDNNLHSMHPFLIAVGPGFVPGYRLPHLQSVDVYPIMCQLLGLPPGPNNGSLSQARCFLAGMGCVDISLVVGLVVGVLLVLTTLTGLFKLWRPGRPLSSRPFQRLSIQDDDDDDDPLLD
ncbi:bis(5'-adenosyl)-triphosphatase enpp4 [Esox lucius]|uniref:bis(5'-adenosyl)-triphosphatase n=1 Tax=Esox lucius TaxID=8010 RepID=A0A3P8YAA4_ESOLU|nr:bis(5'-adenosyl)-triphosphatase enpp4 [Esox lucius]XP_012992895.1 bis(5'-adenosyl)-triphosphatase enpp4 [Esox lucius]XP_019909768.1 bis(5'-adenosyl)-triphosphatase enpp4 [Esox lucius]